MDFVLILLPILFLLIIIIGCANNEQHQGTQFPKGDIHPQETYYTEYRTYKPTLPTYDKLLHSPQWKAKRNEILERDNHQCQWCKREDHLQVHHKYYLKYPNEVKKNPWEYDNDALMTLCSTCHKKYHEKYPVKTYYTKFR